MEKIVKTDRKIVKTGKRKTQKQQHYHYTLTSFKLISRFSAGVFAEDFLTKIKPSVDAPRKIRTRNGRRKAKGAKKKRKQKVTVQGALPVLNLRNVLAR